MQSVRPTPLLQHLRPRGEDVWTGGRMGRQHYRLWQRVNLTGAAIIHTGGQADGDGHYRWKMKLRVVFHDVGGRSSSLFSRQLLPSLQGLVAPTAGPGHLAIWHLIYSEHVERKEEDWQAGNDEHAFSPVLPPALLLGTFQVMNICWDLMGKGRYASPSSLLSSPLPPPRSLWPNHRNRHCPHHAALPSRRASHVRCKSDQLWAEGEGKEERRAKMNERCLRSGYRAPGITQGFGASTW